MPEARFSTTDRDVTEEHAANRKCPYFNLSPPLLVFFFLSFSLSFPFSFCRFSVLYIKIIERFVSRTRNKTQLEQVKSAGFLEF